MSEEALAAMRKRARKIADLVMQENTDYRGNLLNEVSQCLYRDAQGYTGAVFKNAADNYGMELALFSLSIEKPEHKR